MSIQPPEMTEFRVEARANGLVHLVFDCPGRTMNVFSNRAIEDLGRFAEWLHRSRVGGVVVRSGKATGFCAGADLAELGVAYDMIVAAPPADRFDLAFDHFFRLSHAIRRLETAGAPVAAAIAGVALGGGCELALGCHHRVVADSDRALLGLPESRVGLLPGAGGTQRMPRLVGLDAGLDVLLLGRTFRGEEAVGAGLVQRLVRSGEEVAAAEAWLLSDRAQAVQPWDEPGHRPLSHADVAPALERHRARELGRMLGHEPAPLAILDCVELGLIQPIDGAIRAEMSVFARLIQRPEPRNMIRTMFLGKQAYDKALRTGELDESVRQAIAEVSRLVAEAVGRVPALTRAGFGDSRAAAPAQSRVTARYWLETVPELDVAIRSLGASLGTLIARLDPDRQLLLDHAVVAAGSIPPYLGGATGLAALARDAASRDPSARREDRDQVRPALRAAQQRN